MGGSGGVMVVIGLKGGGCYGVKDRDIYKRWGCLCLLCGDRKNHKDVLYYSFFFLSFLSFVYNNNTNNNNNDNINNNTKSIIIFRVR